MNSSLEAILEENDQKLDKIPKEPKPLTTGLEQDEHVAYETVEIVPVPQNIQTNVPWFQLKTEYLADATTTLSALAKKYHLRVDSVDKKAREERWDEQRKDLYKKADDAARMVIQEDLVQVKSRHLNSAKLLQRTARTIIKKIADQMTPKDALQFMVEGIKIEREALGMNKKEPKIVNIITQQQEIIQKYRRKDVIIDTTTTVDGGDTGNS